MELACKCGAAWDHGNKGKTQCTSNMFRVLNVDMDKSTAMTYRSANVDSAINVSETAGNKVKVFLWNASNIIPLETNKELTVTTE